MAVEGGIVEAAGWNQYGGWRVGIRSLDGKRYWYYAHRQRPTPNVKTPGHVVTYPVSPLYSNGISWYLRHSRESKAGDYVITPGALRGDLEWLQKNGYHTVVVQDLLNYVEQGQVPPQRPGGDDVIPRLALPAVDAVVHQHRQVDGTLGGVHGGSAPHLHFGLQLIFDESQKEGNGEIWVDLYSNGISWYLRRYSPFSSPGTTVQRRPSS